MPESLVEQKEETFESMVLDKLDSLTALIREYKPRDRSDRDRKFAIMLTEVEKLDALFKGLILW